MSYKHLAVYKACRKQKVLAKVGRDDKASSADN